MKVYLGIPEDQRRRMQADDICYECDHFDEFEPGPDTPHPHPPECERPYCKAICYYKKGASKRWREARDTLNCPVGKLQHLKDQT